MNNNIKLSCFVGDRLRAQVKALDHLHPESIQNKFFDVPDYCSVFFVPCICHILNRSLLDSIKKSENLKEGVQLLNSLQVLLRKPDIYSIINRFIPSLVETRWIYLFDAAFWAVKNKEIINSVFMMKANKSIQKYLKQKKFECFQNGIPDIIDDIYLIMLPIKCFFDKIESTNAPLWWIKPLFKELKNHLSDVQGKLKILSTDCETILNDFKRNYKMHARTELINTAFSFTSIGRNHFRQKYVVKHINDLENEYPDAPHIDFSKYNKFLTHLDAQFILTKFESADLSSSDSDDEENSNQTNLIFNKEEEEDDESLSDELTKNEKKDHNQIIQDDESNAKKKSFKSKLKKNTLLDYYQKTTNDVFDPTQEEANPKISNEENNLNPHHWNQLNLIQKEGSYQCSLYCIKELCKCLKFEKEKRRKIIKQYNDFFEYSCELLPNGDLIYDSNEEFWISATTSVTMKDLSEIALTFLSLPATQSVCERNISIKRSAVSKQQYKMKNDILTARARLSCLKDKIQIQLYE